MRYPDRIYLLSNSLPFRVSNIIPPTPLLVFTMFSKVIVITGGNTGIGYNTVKALLEHPQQDEKLTILITSRSLERAMQALADLKGDNKFAAIFEQGHQVVPYALNLDDDAAIEAFAAKVGEEHGKVDVLINNAGM